MKESHLKNKTAIATNDYVRMVDKNGNSVKIKKDSFMAAIRDALPSIISDGETGGGSVLSIINGALKTRTDANLASVLGVMTNRGEYRNGDLNNLDNSPGVYNVRPSEGTIEHCPISTYGTLVQFAFGDVASQAYTIQLLMSRENEIYIRHKVSSWSIWLRIATS